MIITRSGRFFDMVGGGEGEEGRQKGFSLFSNSMEPSANLLGITEISGENLLFSAKKISKFCFSSKNLLFNCCVEFIILLCDMYVWPRLH